MLGLILKHSLSTFLLHTYVLSHCYLRIQTADIYFVVRNLGVTQSRPLPESLVKLQAGCQQRLCLAELDCGKMFLPAYTPSAHSLSHRAALLWHGCIMQILLFLVWFMKLNIFFISDSSGHIFFFIPTTLDFHKNVPYCEKGSY